MGIVFRSKRCECCGKPKAECNKEQAEIYDRNHEEIPEAVKTLAFILGPVEYLGQEMTLENVEAFIKKRGRAACSDLMKAFRISYYQAVKLMDALEARQVVKPCPANAGPRELCN